ncbi:tetratricopeptide repeat protein, partial [bacterium]|nr:tetratricopeptide repeat protein [bacterium]
DYDPAIEIYTRYLSQFGDSAGGPEAARRLAKAYYEKQEFQKARDAFNFLLERYPADEQKALVLHSRALCEIQLGDKPIALQTLRRIQQQYPDYEPEKIEKLIRFAGTE